MKKLITIVFLFLVCNLYSQKSSEILPVLNVDAGIMPSNFVFVIDGTNYWGKTSATNLVFPISQITNLQTTLDSKVGIPLDNIVTRSINSSTYTISSTKVATVRYNIKITCTASIGSNSLGRVNFQYSTNGGSSWIEAGEVENSNTVTLAIALNATTTQSGFIVWSVPANALCRLVPTSTGTTTITWIRGQESY